MVEGAGLFVEWNGSRRFLPKNGDEFGVGSYVRTSYGVGRKWRE